MALGTGRNWRQLAHIWANQETESTVELGQLENLKVPLPATVAISSGESLPILLTQHYQLGLSGQTQELRQALHSSHTSLLQTFS